MELKVNGMEVEVEEGDSLLEAAERAGFKVPTLCHHPAVPARGSCRVCLVEEEGSGGLLTACDTPAREGMSILLDTERVLEARREALRLIFSAHPAHCEVCEAANVCRLKELTAGLGMSGRELPVNQDFRPVVDANPFYHRDLSKCISCGLCVSACQEVQGVGNYEMLGRGAYARPGTALDTRLEASVCEFCGLCASMCPVGALVEKPFLHRGVEEKRVATVCPYCGVGCSLVLRVRENRIVGVEAGVENSVNGWSLCVKGRYGLDFVDHPDRLRKPLLRREEGFVEVGWEEALDFVATRLRDIRERYGPDSIAFLSSAKATNEENYLLQKLARAVVGTNNVDHCARLCHSPTVAGLATALGSGAMTNPISDLGKAEAILLTGSNTTVNHPVIGESIKRAALSGGTKLIVVDPRDLPIARYAWLRLRPRPGTDVAWINGMARVILEEGLVDERFVRERTEGFEELRRTLEEYTPERVEEITGIPAGDLREAARLYAGAERAAIVYAMGITQHVTGTDNVMALANLALLTGNLGKEGAGIYPLRGQNNVQGACDMGALPDYLPGYQRVDDPEANAKFSQAWGKELPGTPGLSVVEMIDAARRGEIRAMYIMGENPLVTDPDVGHVEEGLRKLDLLVVQDIFLTETAELAHVVLPGACFAEKDGTFTNTERRVQRVRKAVEPPGEAREDASIIAALAERLGYPMGRVGAAALMEEIASLTPSYAGISYRRLERGGLQWPCPHEDHPGTPVLHMETFPRGKGKLSPMSFRPADELPDEEYPFIFTTGRLLYHFHSGSLTRRVRGLAEKVRRGWVSLNPEDAARLGLSEGDGVRVSSRRGSLISRAHISPRLQPGVVFATFHFREENANVLTNPALDPVSRIPDLKVCAVKVEKVEGRDGG
ncbi:MAG: formate dehydrogenase subunit alpha [Actinomycetota bacterium]